MKKQAGFTLVELLVVEEQAGLTMQIDQLGLNAMATSINEGYADLFSCLMTGDHQWG